MGRGGDGKSAPVVDVAAKSWRGAQFIAPDGSDAVVSGREEHSEKMNETFEARKTRDPLSLPPHRLSANRRMSSAHSLL
jgi:hypothetical protein